MLRGGGCLVPLPPAPPPAPASVIVVVIVIVVIIIVVATPSATCDEDQRDRRYACETELEEAAAGYLFPGLHRHPPSGVSVDYVTIALLQGFPRITDAGNSVSENEPY